MKGGEKNVTLRLINAAVYRTRKWSVGGGLVIIAKDLTPRAQDVDCMTSIGKKEIVRTFREVY